MHNDMSKAALVEAGAFYEWDGTPERPHCILTSGRHSPFFVNISKLLEDPWASSNAMMLLAKKAQLYGQSDERNGLRKLRVVGQAMGSVSLSSRFAEIVGALTAFTEKGDGKKMELKRFSTTFSVLCAFLIYPRSEVVVIRYNHKDCLTLIHPPLQNLVRSTAQYKAFFNFFKGQRKFTLLSHIIKKNRKQPPTEVL